MSDAQARLPELLGSLAPNGSIIITQDDKPVASLSSSGPRPSLRSLTPVSVGQVLVPLSGEDDLLAEMQG